MKFMNSKNGYANFASKQAAAARVAAKAANKTKDSVGSFIAGPKGVNSPGGKLALIPKPLENTFAKAELQKPGIVRSVKSTVAGVSQSAKNLFGTQGKNGVAAKSTIAGLKQKGRDVAYGGGQMLKNAGKFAKNNKVATGLAAAGALGAVGYGAYRKMRSDKGKKRGSNNN